MRTNWQQKRTFSKNAAINLLFRNFCWSLAHTIFATQHFFACPFFKKFHDMELNFFSATQAHQRWKTRLLSCLRSDCADLDPTAISAQDHCGLGIWLKEVQARPHPLSAETGQLFEELLHEHAEFHRSAAHAAQQLAEGGKSMEILQAIQNGDFSKHANRVQELLGALYEKRSEFGIP